MQHAVMAAAPSRGPAATAPLAGAIGRPVFIDTLLEAGKRLGGADFVSMFLYPDRERTVFVGTASSLGRDFAMLAANSYQARCYLDDPNRAVMFRGAETLPAPWVHTYMRRDDFPSLQYRVLCYDRARIADRLSLISANRYGTAFSVSFYSGSPNGNLTEAGRQGLIDAFPLIQAIAARHTELTQPGTELPDVLLRVRVNFPELSPREAEVASGVVTGLSAADMGDWLGIAETSVITHRKRAYERLGIAGQLDLVRLYYGRL